MLPPNYLENLASEAIKIYNNLELEIIKEIAERISNVGYANTVVQNDIKIAQEMGLLYQDIVNMVAEYNDESYEKIQKIFNDAGSKTLQFDDSVYIEAGLKPIPLKQDKAMLQILTATAVKTNSNLQNLVMTTANTSQNEFINAMNTAYMEVSTGIKSYSQSIIDTINKISSKGTTVEYPSGYKTSIENATRMNIITGASQSCGKLQLMRAEELEWDLMELTAHIGARPTHAQWQGRIVSLSGKTGYLSLDDIGYGTATGFKGINCYHDWRPYYEGSTRTYTNKELEKMENETVRYNGQEISRYDANQMQRKMERQIRQDKKDIAGIQGLLTSNNKDIDINSIQSELKQLQNKYNIHNNILKDFIVQTNSKKDKTRLYVGKNVTKSNESDTIKEKSEILKTLKNSKIEYNPVQKLKSVLSESEIIQRVGGGDTTRGSCASLSFAYIANKNGLDVLDFRGGASQKFFSTTSNICEIAKLPKVKSNIEENFNDIIAAMNLLKTMEVGKEYYLATGSHATIIRMTEKGYQYLELQTPNANGFKNLTTKTLKDRFGCRQSHSVQGYKLKVKNILIDIDSLKNNPEFEEILGYINTAKTKQYKGESGNAK